MREHTVDDATYAAAVAAHGEAGVADLIHALGYYVLTCLTLNTFQVGSVSRCLTRTHTGLMHCLCSASHRSASRSTRP